MIFETGPFENRNYTKRADVNTLRILGCFVAIMPRKDSWGENYGGWIPAFAGMDVTGGRCSPYNTKRHPLS